MDENWKLSLVWPHLFASFPTTALGSWWATPTSTPFLTLCHAPIYSIIWDRQFCYKKAVREVSISARKNPSAWRFEKMWFMSFFLSRVSVVFPKHIDIEFSLTRPYRELALDSQPCTVTRRSCHKLPLGSSGSAFQCSLAARIPGHVEMPNRAEQEVHWSSDVRRA